MALGATPTWCDSSTSISLQKLLGVPDPDVALVTSKTLSKASSYSGSASFLQLQVNWGFPTSAVGLCSGEEALIPRRVVQCEESVCIASILQPREWTIMQSITIHPTSKTLLWVVCIARRWQMHTYHSCSKPRLVHAPDKGRRSLGGSGAKVWAWSWTDSVASVAQVLFLVGERKCSHVWCLGFVGINPCLFGPGRLVIFA